jgi:hypothetical protein
MAAILLIGMGTSATHAELFSKTYAFKLDTVLEVGAEVAEGVTIDSVRFVPPSSGENAPLIGPVKAEVSISNLGKGSKKVGLAIALLDGEARLLSATSGGTKMFPLRAERQMKYVLSFGDVYSEINSATVFKLCVETKP